MAGDCFPTEGYSLPSSCFQFDPACFCFYVEVSNSSYGLSLSL